MHTDGSSYNYAVLYSDSVTNGIAFISANIGTNASTFMHTDGSSYNYALTSSVTSKNGIAFISANIDINTDTDTYPSSIAVSNSRPFNK